MNEISASNLEAMIEYYERTNTETDFVNFQKELRWMKKRVAKIKKENPRFNAMADEIIEQIEKYQTMRFAGLLERYYQSKEMEITAMISGMKHFINAKERRGVRIRKNEE